MKRLCSICGRPSIGRGWCSLHYQRWQKHGDPLADVKPKKAPRGAPLAFLMAALDSETDACIDWPYSCHRDGHGKLLYEGRFAYASRVVCILAYGDPPSAGHEAAHRCGNHPCINRRHLRWATSAENKEDMNDHGTKLFGERHGNAVLSERDVRDIRRLIGTASQRSIAMRFGVSQGTISAIKTGKIWSWLGSPPEKEAIPCAAS